jgi:hypothetical protein
MKKLFLAIGLASLFFTACNIAPKEGFLTKNQDAKEKHKIDTTFVNLLNKFENWEDLDSTLRIQFNKQCMEYFASLDTHQIAAGENTLDPVSEMSENEKAAHNINFAKQKEAWIKAFENDDRESRKIHVVRSLTALLSQVTDSMEVIHANKVADSTQAQ